MQFSRNAQLSVSISKDFLVYQTILHFVWWGNDKTVISAARQLVSEVLQRDARRP